MKQIILAVFCLALVLPAAAATGYLKADGDPGDAGLFVDGKYLGPAVRYTFSVKYELEEGTHEVLLQDPRYEDFKTSVTITAGQVTKLKYELKKLAVPQGPFGTLKFGRGKPETFMSMVVSDTAAVYLNGRFVGHVEELNHVGTGLLLPAGQYQLQVSSPMHGEINQTVEVVAGKTTKVKLPRE
jgi:hypothetical protein